MSELDDLQDEIQSTIGPPLKQVRISTTMTCMGENCDDIEFSTDELGCSELLSLCAKCHKKIKEQLSGEWVDMFVYCFNLYHYCRK
jgi:hypothetical protein